MEQNSFRLMVKILRNMDHLINLKIDLYENFI